MTVWQYAVRRFLLLVPVLFGILLISFTLSRVIPSDPVMLAAGPNATEEMIERLRQDFGFDRPLPEQFVRYVASMFRGDLGRSLTTRRPVWEDIRHRFPATLELVLAAIFLGQAIGIPAGLIAARFEHRWPDNLSRLFSLSGISLPNFWWALILQFIAATVLRGLFPVSGRFPIEAEVPAVRTGLLTLDSILAQNWTALGLSLKHLLLPALALSTSAMVTTLRISRASMAETMHMDFIMAARAAGIPDSVIIVRHALKHSLIPIITMAGLEFIWGMAGAVLVETIFNWPGLGHYIVEASVRLDYNPIMGSMLALGFTAGIANMLVDIAYAFVDPRIRQG